MSRKYNIDTSTLNQDTSNNTLTSFYTLEVSCFDINMNKFNYQIVEKSFDDIELEMKENYPLQYSTMRSRFESKVRKILKANQDLK